MEFPRSGFRTTQACSVCKSTIVHGQDVSKYRNRAFCVLYQIIREDKSIIAKRRSVSSPAQFNLTQKHSKKHFRRQWRKLKSSSQDLSSQEHDQKDVTQKPSSADKGEDIAEWIVVITTFMLEMLSATFFQLSSPTKPFYTLIGVTMSLIALSIYVGWIVYKAKKDKLTWRQIGSISLLYHVPLHKKKQSSSLLDWFVLACTIGHPIVCILEFYAYFVRHANNHTYKLCLAPVFFAACFSFFFSRLIKFLDRKVPFTQDVGEDASAARTVL